VGGYGGFGGGGGDPFAGDPAAGFSAYGQQEKKGTPWVKILVATGIGILFILGLYYMLSGESVAVRDVKEVPEETPEEVSQNQRYDDSNGANEPPQPDDSATRLTTDPPFEEWDPAKHDRSQNVEHEEMADSNGHELHNDLAGLAKKGEMFFNMDIDKDAFLSGNDVVYKGTMDLLDANNDLAISFLEFTHGFSHVPDDRKVDVFKTFYGQVYGQLIPNEWEERKHFTGVLPEDDRHLLKDSLKENFMSRNLPHRDNKKADGETPAAPEVETPPPADDGPMGSAEDATMNMDPGEMTDEELNKALDQDFVRMDADNDGIVTLTEYKAWDHGNAEVEADFNILDRNHDGKLTRVELSGTDDHSSYVSHEEHEKHHNELHEKHVKSKQEAIEKAQALGTDTDAAGKAADEEADDADDDEELEEAQLFAEFERMDTDKDNKVSEDEYVKWAEQANPGDTSARHNFRLIDRNKSKKLTFRELFPTSIRQKDLHYDPSKEKHEDESDDADHDDEHHEEHHEQADAVEDPDALIQAKFDSADQNSDGRLSAAEADAIGLRDEEGSVKADDNKDGYVDFAEFKADKLRL